MTETLTQQSIAHWCQRYVAGLLDQPADSIALDATFDRLGIDSAHAVALLIEIESRYGIDLPPEALFENPTLDAVARYLYEHSS